MLCMYNVYIVRLTPKYAKQCTAVKRSRELSFRCFNLNFFLLRIAVNIDVC